MNTPVKNYFTSTNELKLILKKLNNKKSAGFDGIPNTVLRNIPDNLIFLFAIIFNNALNNMYFPNQWKLAKVIALHKKGKESSDPSSYRPISLLPNISKIFEIFIYKALISHCVKNDILPNQQFGFRHKHSTIHAINKFTSDICWNLNSEKCVGAVFVDLEKAFDTVWLDGLFFELLKKEFPLHLVKLVWNMVHGKRFLVSDGREFSNKTFEVSNGLQQGTVNSPLLFNIYTCDLLKLFGLNDDPEKKSVAFADDLLIYISDEKSTVINDSLQVLFEKISDYYHTWKLKINTTKCETILLRPTLKNTSYNVKKHWKSFQLKEEKNSDIIVPHKGTVRYLGVFIDYQLKYTKHVEIQLEKAKKAFQSLTRLFYKKHIFKKVKILCYLLLIRPIITYACPIWFNIPAHLMEKLRLFERYCLRACLSMYRMPELNRTKMYKNEILYNAAKIPRIDNHILRLCRNHIVKASKIDPDLNSLISRPFYPQDSYFIKAMSSGYTPPEIFTYLDSNGFIIDENNIPLIYHAYRTNNLSRAIDYAPNINYLKPENLSRIKFSTDIPDRDKELKLNEIKKYWWRYSPPDDN